MRQPEQPPDDAASPGEWARYWQRFGLAVGPFEVRPKDSGGWRKQPARKWSERTEGGAWWGLGDPSESWRAGWRPGLHLGRSRAVILDIDAPPGHPDRPPLEVQLRDIAAAAGVDPVATAPGAWQTGGGGRACLYWLAPDVEIPPRRRVVTLPGCAFTVELLSGEWCAMLPHGSMSAPFYPLLRPFIGPDDPNAAPMPAALWAALTAAHGNDESAESAEPLTADDVGRLEAVARCYDAATQSGRAWRALCPCCARRDRVDRRLIVYMRRDGRIGRRCYGGCSAAAIDYARPLPRDVAPFTARGRADVDPALAADLGRLLAAAEAAIVERAPWRERRGDRRVFYAVSSIARAAGTLVQFNAAYRTIGHVGGLTLDSLRGGADGGKAGIGVRVLRRYPDLIQRPTLGIIAADGIVSSRWTLTPPAAGAELAAPAILSGGNAARGMTKSTGARSDAWRLFNAWPDDGAAAMSATALAACVPGKMAPSTARRMLAAALADGLVFVAPVPPGKPGRGRPAALYACAPDVRAAIAAGDDDALAALLPRDRQGRADAVADKITSDHRRLSEAHKQGGLRGAWQHIYLRREIERKRKEAFIDNAQRRAAAKAYAAMRAEDAERAAAALAIAAGRVEPAADAADIAAADVV